MAAGTTKGTDSKEGDELDRDIFDYRIYGGGGASSGDATASVFYLVLVLDSGTCISSGLKRVNQKG